MLVLVVEDSDTMRKILVKSLMEVGLTEDQIHEAHNGAAALRKLHSEKYDVLLLDIVMDGIDGISVLKEAKGVQPGAKVVMCSSFSESGTVRELIDMGINDFIVKPFSPDRLKDTLTRVLSECR